MLHPTILHIPPKLELTGDGDLRIVALELASLNLHIMVVYCGRLLIVVMETDFNLIYLVQLRCVS